MNKIILILIGILLVGVGYFAGTQSKSSQNQTTQTSTLGITFAQQRQCGIDAREIMKQYSTQSLIESSYSSKLQSCVAYTQTIDTDHITAPTDKSIYNVTTNKLLGGYIYIAPTTTHGYTSEYWINTDNNPGGQKVSLYDYNKYIQSLGLHIYQ